MDSKTLVLVLGDQLSLNNPALRNAKPQVDTLLLAEVAEEAQYVRHNRHKLVLLFSAMRHFAELLRARGFTVIYRQFDEGVASLTQACTEALAALPEVTQLRVCASGEYRVEQIIGSWPQQLGVSVDRLEDDRYLCAIAQFKAWAKDRKQLRMEYFYRDMRKQYGLLLDDGEPCGGKWNYDAENRMGWRNQEPIPRRPDVSPDDITREVIEQVRAAFPHNPGDLDQFRLAVTHTEAQAQFDWFCEFGLAQFGRYQDALAEESPWLFHSLVSMYLNCGLLEPLAVCQQVEQAYRLGHCSLAAAEGFIRQVLGWREYVRGVYWLLMPEYAQRNTFGAKRPLPDFFWDGDTDLRCLQQALSQSLDLGYAHHIQRLMVIGISHSWLGLMSRRFALGIWRFMSMPMSGLSCPTPWVWRYTVITAPWPLSPMPPAASTFKSRVTIAPSAATTPVKPPGQMPALTTVCIGTSLIDIKSIWVATPVWD